jgi:hypothetical protein
MFSQLPLNQVMSGMDLVPPNNDQVYIDLTGESSDDEPLVHAAAARCCMRVHDRSARL